MSYQVAIVFSLTALTAALGYLIAVFENQGLKVLFALGTLYGSLLIARLGHRIAEDGTGATGDIWTDLNLIFLTSEILIITIISIVMAYFLISYTMALLKSIKDSKGREKKIDWDIF